MLQKVHHGISDVARMDVEAAAGLLRTRVGMHGDLLALEDLVNADGNVLLRVLAFTKRILHHTVSHL